MSFGVRRVVTGIDAAGQAVFVSDGPPPHMVDTPSGAAVADLWVLTAPPSDPADGIDPTGGFALDPAPGGLWWRLIRLPLPDQSLPREEQFLHQPADDRFSSARPGMHATPSIDFMVVTDGQIELEVEDGCVLLAPGDCVVQRGTQHRWRVVGDGPCTYATAMFAIDPAAVPQSFDLVSRHLADAGAGPRRVVTGVDAQGRSIIESDGTAPNSIRFANGAGMAQADLWQTGGAVADPRQGGDAPPISFQLDPLGMGIAWKYIELPSSAARAGIEGAALRAEMAAVASGMSRTGHHDPNDPGNHRTDTIDLDLILEGDVELELVGHGSTRLGPGDVVVQRGNWHKWHNRGDGPMRMLAIMVGAPIGGRQS
ncbi:MAG TPA: cupin domain-containing protein [Acidimicrobiales bacterium]|jgi:mannose-6-phosphate isomerase-like protein (cupin superfamily)|nr:cupin domain-containing protein [Acidimicrobiales bacterium]